MPQNESKHGGADMFAALYADPARLKEFLGAMTGISHGANMAIAREFPWKDHTTFVDVGTAQGDLAVQIALANPHLKGIGFDLAAGGADLRGVREANGLAIRCVRSRRLLQGPLPKADVVMMGHILHDWDLPTKKMLIKKAYDALPAGGAFIVYEAIIDDDRSKNTFGLLMSLNMLIETPGGFDYTGADCAGWMKEAGFSRPRRAPRRPRLDGRRHQVAPSGRARAGARSPRASGSRSAATVARHALACVAPCAFPASPSGASPTMPSTSYVITGAARPFT